MFESMLWSTKKADKKSPAVATGLARLRAAQEHERAGSTAEALRAYEEGLAQLLAALRSEQEEGARRDELVRTIDANMSKAEDLKKRVSKSKPPDHHDYTRVPRRRPTSAAPQSNAPSSSASYADKILSEVLLPSGGTTWDDIAGLAEAKRTLQEAVVLPYLRPDLYRGLRSPARGVLLYGPPGTGKTLLARAVASESGLSFFSVSASTLTSKWLGEGEKLVRGLFEAAQLREPAAIFLDELDALLSKRGDAEHEASRRLKTEFLVRLDGIATDAGRVLVFGATNRPWDIDDAVLRRLPRRIHIPLPDPPARRAMLDKLLDGPKGVPHALRSVDKDRIVAATDNFSMSDLRALAEEAALACVDAFNAVPTSCAGRSEPWGTKSATWPVGVLGALHLT